MVWSSDIGATHEPPSNIVMKSQKWFTADTMTTMLLNNEGEVSFFIIIMDFIDVKSFNECNQYLSFFIS